MNNTQFTPVMPTQLSS